MRAGHRIALTAAIGIAGLACSVDPEGEGTSFTPMPEPSTGAVSTSTGPPPPMTSDSSGGSTSTGGTTGTSTGETEGSTGEPINTVECRGTFPLMWQNGEDCMTEFPFEVQQYGYGTAMLRQTLCVHPGGPFLYMLFGEDKAMLIDSGSGDITLSPTVFGVVDDWLAATGQESIELVVVNTHEDDAHHSGNFQFANADNTTIVGPSQAEIQAFFGIDDWPNQIVEYDLGGRVLDIIPTMGHHPGHIVIYDRQTGILFTGDNLLPGRIIIPDFEAFLPAIERLVEFTETRDVCHVLGSHIDMTIKPGVSYMFGELIHLAEHGLPLYRDHLLELYQALLDMKNAPHTEIHDEFVIMPV